MPPKHPHQHGGRGGRGGHGGGRGGHGGGGGWEKQEHEEESKKHEGHHYMRQYGGKVVNAATFGFGSQLGRDAANALVGDAKEWWRH